MGGAVSETALRYRDGMAGELRDVEAQLANLTSERDALQSKIDLLSAQQAELKALLKHHAEVAP